MSATTDTTPASRIPRVDWPTALVIAAGLATVLGLVALKQSLPNISLFIGGCSTVYLAFRTAIQGRAVEEVKSLANGNNEALRAQIGEARSEMLALSKEHAKVVALLAAKWPTDLPLPTQLTEPAQATTGHSP